jgi:hypothetical protein
MRFRRNITAVREMFAERHSILLHFRTRTVVERYCLPGCYQI